MEDYKKRFVKEYNELKERADKLAFMLAKYSNGELDFEPDCPINLLKMQYHAMRTYMHILKLRAEIEDIKL